MVGELYLSSAILESVWFVNVILHRCKETGTESVM